MPVPQKVVGIPWFASDSYRACRAMMMDGAQLPDMYGDWLMEAEDVLAETEAAGHRALRVMIEPKDFSIWCRARNLAPDARARVRFANFIAFREAGYVSGNSGSKAGGARR